MRLANPAAEMIRLNDPPFRSFLFHRSLAASLCLSLFLNASFHSGFFIVLSSLLASHETLGVNSLLRLPSGLKALSKSDLL